MTEYKINRIKKTIFSMPNSDEIFFGSPSFDGFTDNELSEYISDFIIHENMHIELNKLFNDITCKLFDAIEYIFRNDELHARIIFKQFGLRRITYQRYIKQKGFQGFLDHYGITNQNIIDANFLCNTRKEPYEWVEIFGVPRHRQIENIEPEDIIRIYPNHVITKIEVL